MIYPKTPFNLLAVKTELAYERMRYRIAKLFFMAYVKGYDFDRINKIYLYYSRKDFRHQDITKSVFFSWLTKDGQLNADKVWGFMVSREILGHNFCSRESTLRCKAVVFMNFNMYRVYLNKIEEVFGQFKNNCRRAFAHYSKHIYQ